MKEKEVELSNRKLVQIGLHGTTVASIDRLAEMVNQISKGLGGATRTSVINDMFKRKTPEQIFDFLTRESI